MQKPYVYKLTHKITGQFYIGYRCANKTSAIDDIYKYQSSSKIVKNIGFDNFSVEIVQEFEDKNAAYDAEQILIFENRHNPLILNKSWRSNGKRFINTGHSDETKKKMSASRRGVKKSRESIEKMRSSKIGTSRPDLKGIPKKDDVKIKISEKLLGVSKPVIECPHCGKSGGKPVMMRYHFNNCKHLLGNL